MQSHPSCAHSQVDAGPVETGDQPMFIAMNRFRVKKGSEQAFEKVWLSSDTQLTNVPGFVEFHLLKGPEHEDFTLYSSTPFGKARQRSKPGQGRRNSAPPTRMRARTSRSTWTIPNSRASRCARLCVGARLRSPSSGATPHCRVCDGA